MGEKCVGLCTLASYLSDYSLGLFVVSRDSSEHLSWCVQRGGVHATFSALAQLRRAAQLNEACSTGAWEFVQQASFSFETEIWEQCRSRAAQAPGRARRQRHLGRWAEVP